MFYACFTLIWSWERGKNFRIGIFLNKNLLGYGYRKQTTFFFLGGGGGGRGLLDSNLCIKSTTLFATQSNAVSFKFSYTYKSKEISLFTYTCRYIMVIKYHTYLDRKCTNTS